MQIDETLRLKGQFIVFEGLDGAGTTTQTTILANWIQEQGYDVIPTKEPTEGLWGGIIRNVLTQKVDAHPMALCHAFIADRIDHVQWLHGQSKLYDNPIILSDRYFLSFLAYQHQSVSKGMGWLSTVQRGLPLPKLTFFLDVPPTICYERLRKSRLTTDLYENLDTLRKIYKSYVTAINYLLKRGNNIVTLDGTQSVELISNQIIDITRNILVQ